MPEAQTLKLRPEDEAKAKARARKRLDGPKITDENLLVAEFGIMYGYEAVRAVLSDEVAADEFSWLLEAGRRVEAKRTYNLSSAVFTAVACANSKKPSQEFTKAAAGFLKAAKADA